jgi:L-alanine-DL-glutamate epimerase-like enolase superfamily enzyme
MPWLTRLFEEVPQPVNGELAMPSAPGLGLNFNWQTIDRYRVA